MKISSIYNTNYISTPQNSVKNKPVANTESRNIEEKSGCSVPLYPYMPSFSSSQKVRNISLKIEEDKKKIHRQLKEILDTNYSESAPEDLEAKARQIANGYFSNIERQKDEIFAQIESLMDDKTLKPRLRDERLYSLVKQYKSLNNKLKKGVVITFSSDKNDEKVDLILVNKLKNAIEENNFNLDKVAEDYYSDLEKISTIEEINKHYPKIKTPARPADVIARKCVSILTKDFYKEIDSYYESGDNSAITDCINNKIIKILNDAFPKNPELAQNVYLQTGLQIGKEILKYYEKIKLEDRIDSVPELRKVKVPQISEADIKLLFLDYDDFVTNVIKQHFLEGKRLNTIVYEKEGIKIPLTTIKDPDYKFEKQSEKIKGIIKASLKIKQTERDYSIYDIDSLKNRLNYYASTPIGNNEKILDLIINFATCNFEEDDIKQLRKFLPVLDKIYDNEKTPDEVIGIIKAEDIKPIGTERSNLEAKIQAEKMFKEEQKKTALLSKIKKEFDDLINILYKNNLNNLANTCTAYRPQNLDRETLQNARYIRDVINANLSEENKEVIENRANTEVVLSNWHTYNSYKKNYPDSEILKNAINYAKQKDGKVDKNKAGQYLVNYDYVKNYPDSLAFSRTPQILETIMDKNKDNQEKQIEYLCKYNDYEMLSAQEKTKLQCILKLFNIKDSTDKAILKNIIENDYINLDTQEQIKQGNGVLTTTFAKTAKQQICDKYKFPLCLDFFEGFEMAIGILAPAENATGIKQTGKNNKALKYKMEAKLAGHDDRLFSSLNNYYFDIYDAVGMH